MSASGSNPGGNAPSASGSGSGPAQRRSRKTTDLTTEQVTKKRAMDRANQRTYRAKNKAHVRCLEDKIAELTYRLTEAEDRVRSQANIIRRLGGSEELSSNQESTSPRSTAPSAQTPGGSSLAATHGETPPAHSQIMPPPLPMQRASGFGQDVDMSVQSMVDNQLAQVPQPHDLITMGDFEQFLDNVGLDFGGPLAPNPFAPSQVFNLLGRSPFETNTFMEPPAEQSVPTLPQIQPHHPQGNTYIHPGSATTSVVVDSSSASASASESDHPSPDSLPPWKRMIMHTPPNTHLEEIIINSSRAWRTRFLQTAPPENSGGRLGPPRLPGIASLLNRVSPTTGAPSPPKTTTSGHKTGRTRLPVSAGAPGDAVDSEGDGDPDDGVREGVPRPLSLALAAQVERSPYRQLTERIALTYKLSYLLRWMVCQTRETYEAMPAYMRPTTLQTTVPHPAWIDAITWPGARDAIIDAGARAKKRQEEGNESDVGDTGFDWEKDLDAFQQISGRSTSVGWPYPDSGAFIESADGQYLMLHPLFEAHIRKAENWTCAPELVRRFPLMRPYSRDVE